MVDHSNGTRIGAPAKQTGVASSSSFMLLPGAVASAAVIQSRAQNYGDCTATAADGLKVFLPGETDSLFIAYPTTGCANSTIVLLTVEAFQTG